MPLSRTIRAREPSLGVGKETLPAVYELQMRRSQERMGRIAQISGCETMPAHRKFGMPSRSTFLQLVGSVGVGPRVPGW